MILTDLQGKIEYANPKFAQISGYSDQDLVGMDSGRLESGDTPSMIYQELRQTAASNNIWRGELCNRKKDGDLCFGCI